MLKARNGARHSDVMRADARHLRSLGWTHREIAGSMEIGLGTAFIWTRGIVISPLQSQAIAVRRRQRSPMSESEKKEVGERLKPFRKKYTADELITLIREFHKENGRIPLKREFNLNQAYASQFGSWNKAIRSAGFEPNPVLFAKRFRARDGHVCDSFTERIIDNWLTGRGIAHARNSRYGDTKYTADFELTNGTFIEFFGLAGAQKNYDLIIERKRELARRLGHHLLEIYPEDIYPKNKLADIITF